MSVILHVPIVVRVKKAEDITAAVLKIQVRESGKVFIHTITQDVKTGDWIIIFYPIRNLGGSVM